MIDLSDNSVCEECAMICTDAYSDEEYEEMVVYGDQGITSKKFDKETYVDLMNTDSDKEPVIILNETSLLTIYSWELTTTHRHSPPKKLWRKLKCTLRISQKANWIA